MRKTFPLILLAALSANASAQSGRRITAPPPTQAEPAVQAPPSAEPIYSSSTVADELSALPESILKHQFQSLGKSSFRLADFSGSVLVLNLWATWCGPCRMEVPDYEKVRREYAGRNVEFIGLTTEDPRAASDRVKQFVRDFNFGFRIAWADRETALTLMNGRNSIPQTFVIAADGHIVSHWRGYSREHSAERLREMIERALER